MEIIREATFNEVVKLEGVKLSSESTLIWIITAILLIFIGAVLFTSIFQVIDVLAWALILIVFIGVGGLVYTYTHLVPNERAEYADHPYYLAMIDNSDDFEHDSFRLVDHHKDNTYFVEDVRNSEEN